MAKKSKTKKWFIPVRGSYLPNSRQGWLTYIPFTIYLIATLIIGWKYTDSHLKALIFIAFCWAVATLLMTLLAKEKS